MCTSNRSSVLLNKREKAIVLLKGIRSNWEPKHMHTVHKTWTCFVYMSHFSTTLSSSYSLRTFPAVLYRLIVSLAYSSSLAYFSSLASLLSYFSSDLFMPTSSSSHILSFHPQRNNDKLMIDTQRKKCLHTLSCSHCLPPPHLYRNMKWSHTTLTESDSLS